MFYPKAGEFLSEDMLMADERTHVDASGNVVTDEVLFPLTDQQGTVHDTAKVDAATGVTTVVDHIVYNSFGKVVSETDPSQGSLIGYAGLPFDKASGTNRSATRPYDPSTGQWMRPDLIDLLGRDPNLYRYVHNSPTNATDPTGLRETDDRWTNLTKNLVDVSGILENKINAQVTKDWGIFSKIAKQAGSDPTFLAQQMVRDIYNCFGEDQPGTTVYTYGPVAKIGWLLDNQWLGAAPNQIFKMKFSQSRYLLNKNPWNRPAKNPWLFDERTRDHGLAPVIRVKGVLMGTDKWEHFFQQGYWFWDLAYGSAMASLKKQYKGTTFPDFTQLAVRTAFSEWLEGTEKTRAGAVDPLVTKYSAEFAMIAKFFGIKGVEGIYGAYSTGVISYADMCANEQGFQFYYGLYSTFLKNPTSATPFTFDVDNYDLYNMNEQNNPNTFVNGVIVNDGLDNTIPPMKRPPWVPRALPGPVKPPRW